MDSQQTGIDAAMIYRLGRTLRLRLFGETTREACAPAAVGRGVLLPRGGRFRRPDARVGIDGV